MSKWFKNTDLAILPDIDKVTKKTLLKSLNSLEKINPEQLQLKIFNTLKKKFRVF
jgi:hypothetical protein